MITVLFHYLPSLLLLSDRCYLSHEFLTDIVVVSRVCRLISFAEMLSFFIYALRAAGFFYENRFFFSLLSGPI